MVDHFRIYVVVDQLLYRRELCALLTQTPRFLISAYSNVKEFYAQHPSRETGLVLCGSDSRQKQFPPNLEDLHDHADLPVVAANRVGEDTYVIASRIGKLSDGRRTDGAGLCDYLATISLRLEPAAPEPADRPMSGKYLSRLSAREFEILHHLVDGQSSKMIARLLGVSHRTVDCHRARIMRKLGANNIAKLVTAAYLNGLTITGPSH